MLDLINGQSTETDNNSASESNFKYYNLEGTEMSSVDYFKNYSTNLIYDLDGGESGKLRALRTISFNRDINRPQVEKIKDAISNGELLIPIIIDKNTGTILDGQHRAEAAKELQTTISAIFFDVKSEGEIASLVKIFNTKQKGWGEKDHIKYFAELGIKNSDDYKILQEWVYTKKNPITGKRGISGRVATMFLANEKFTPGALKKGTFRVNGTVDYCEWLFKFVSDVWSSDRFKDKKTAGNWMDPFIKTIAKFMRENDQAIKSLKKGYNGFKEYLKKELRDYRYTQDENWENCFQQILNDNIVKEAKKGVYKDFGNVTL